MERILEDDGVSQSGVAAVEVPTSATSVCVADLEARGPRVWLGNGPAVLAACGHHDLVQWPGSF